MPGRRLGLDAEIQRARGRDRQGDQIDQTEEIRLAEGLSATVQEAVRSLQLPEERINDIVCDVNGERYRGEEWGFVCLRLSHVFDDPTDVPFPSRMLG